VVADVVVHELGAARSPRHGARARSRRSLAAGVLV
jgi:hypothetical protein